MVVVSAGLAQTLWGADTDVLGRTIRVANGQLFTIIGVVGDTRLVDLAGGALPTMYFPTTMYLWPTMTLTVRTAVNPTSVTRAVRDAVASIDPHQPIGGMRTMEDAIAESVATPRLNAWVAAAFAAVALLLAAVGIAGLFGHVVLERGPELALRMAVGASPRRAVWHVLSGALTTSAIGISAGALCALASRQAFANVLFGIAPWDRSTYAATAAFLLVIALVSAWIPARRCAHIDPVSLLR